MKRLLLVPMLLLTQIVIYGQAVTCSPPNEIYSGPLWHIYDANTNQNDADLDALEAWKFSTGKDIVVAILDEGVDLDHPDLANSFLMNGNQVRGFDATDGNDVSGAPLRPGDANKVHDNSHGTSVAGIVSAEIDYGGMEVAGVAHNVKIMPVRIAYRDTNGHHITSDWVKDGVEWAMNNGADVIVNAYTTSLNQSAINMINNAINNGRGGKGCVVLAGAGNNNDGNLPLPNPAGIQNVIAIGASTSTNTRWVSSNYGYELDAVAPGSNIYTTDLTGIYGENNTNYVSDFTGTSAACPSAGAVAAMILAINPNFTQTEVKELLLKNTDKFGSYTYGDGNHVIYGSWDNEVGYGRINALRSVQKAMEKSKLSGNPPTMLCNSPVTFEIDHVPPYMTLSWETHNEIQVESSTANSVTVRKVAGGSGDSWIQPIFNSGCASYELPKHNVWLGVPEALTGNLSGPSQVTQGSSVLYQYSENNGDYDWIYPTGWVKTGGGGTLNHITLQVGSSSGYVEIRKVNDCGAGGSKYIYATVSGSGGGGPCKKNCNPYYRYNPEKKLLQIRAAVVEQGSDRVIAYNKLETQYDIYDLSGRVVKSISTTKQSEEIYVGDLKLSRTYIVRSSNRVSGNTTKKIFFE